ncbi:type II toxin-antitoxin system YafQ family toxin [Alloscardovia theropitheci]|uniref:Type II toxin-antitoxin system YafQ family toxin n=1 Tax=Alloscardovia theropitheci TaxID=2496842 RepID=A0A4R0QP35_9BIFI|nr:type II toxin-antitoxin system YafQ family toxin [Alloscardovia theropitheci]TCD53982.1 type II toxin-antitoxin system YafQ family toxin [Alloscardovia theropitheci]
MSKQVFYTPAYLRDVKRYKAKHYDLDRLFAIIRLIREGATSSDLAQYKDHILEGQYKGVHDLHVYPDIILLYQVTNEQINFIRLATHDELF